MPIIQLLPNAAGDYANIESQSPAGPHWTLIDDPVASPDDDATYLLSISNVAEKEAYNLQPASAIIGLNSVINSVRVYFRIRKSTGDPLVYGRPHIRLGVAETSGTEVSQNLNGGVFTTYSEVLARPGGLAWSIEDLDYM